MSRKHSGRRVIARLGWIAAVLYMGGIFMMSRVPGDDLPLPQFFLSDKIAHFVVYGGLGVLIAFRAGLTSKLLGRPVTHWTKPGWIGPVVGLLYAALDEFHQSFTPNRDPSAGDYIADALGLMLGYWLARTWDTKRMRNAK